MLPDIPWLWNPIYTAFGGDPSETSNALGVARAGRASKAGARAARVVRFIRLVRLVRVFKLYKYFKKNQKGKKEVENQPEETEKLFSSSFAGSFVGEKLGHTTTRIVIMGVLIILFMSPLFLTETVDGGSQFRLDELDAMYSGVVSPPGNDTTLQTRINGSKRLIVSFVGVLIAIFIIGYLTRSFVSSLLIVQL